MASVWKVLAPMDLRFDTEAPVQYASGAAEILSAELILLHVATTRWYQHPHRLGWPPSAWGKHTPSLDIHRLVLPGGVSDTIVRYADHINADMLWMTTRTYGRRTRFWSRSITAEVMDSTQRPVCITKMIDVDSYLRFRCRRVLCLVGLDGQDANVIRQSQEIAHRTDAEVVLLHIVPEVSEGLLAYGAAGLEGRPLSTKLAREKIAELRTGLSVPVMTSVMIGSSAKCIGLAAREHRADLVIAPRVARRVRLERAGTYTTDLAAALSRLDCPLLTVPLGARLDPRTSRSSSDEKPVLTGMSS
jgi:nucleotide-binding universal stress UspA family protein